ncbi:magnesium transporter NIPA-domain-containing protein [Boeremia exigua]|uniref:magnesium transporter NIPA-domain-containing protein n=1 Tax=Boeremia exigua TaxID=749465 RepID=UPI001E8DFB23|nr:magnesium transporter NIPA-domain-containing protein [Boeremia exigua]KAH6643593.1 magnesium transporter NIPA-domain-containing protein [Boeremia exigua]
MDSAALLARAVELHAAYSAEELLAAHHLYARSGGMGGDPASRPGSYKIIGICLAIASGVFIGVSFVIKKHGLLQANAKYNEEAGEGYAYLKNAWWWLGMILMIVGEICNLVAYAFTDAILVTPMGALSVVICALLSSFFLKERLSFVGKVGCFQCIVGSVIIALSAPEQSSVANIQDMKRWVIAPGFLSFAGVIIVASLVIALYLGPKYGKRSMMVYLTVCSLIGGLSVVATQGLGAAVVAQASGSHGGQFKEWFLWVLLVFVVVTLLTEIIYLNKALNLFNAALVTPTYYVFFTSCTIITSAVLFQGFKGTPIQIITVIMGFLTICSGVVLLQLSKSAKDVPDAAVFKGDLDQVRTVAEVEEPEYEPRADAIRGGSAILRSLSTARSHRELQEAKKIKEEHMQIIGEGEAVEFDGIRRRKTIVDPNRPITRAGTIVTRTVHPPLGMTHFPADDSDDDTSSFHPGFFQRLRSRGKSNASRASSVGMTPLPPVPSSGPDHTDPLSDKDYKSPLSQNTAYSHDTYETYDSPYNPHIQFADPPPVHSDATLYPPKPPPHMAKRQFSFTNVFHRPRTDSDASASRRPGSRHSRGTSRARSRDGKPGTEEERLGLVTGDSRHLLRVQSEPEEDLDAVPPYGGGYAQWEARGESPGVSPGHLPIAEAHGAGAYGRVETPDVDPRDRRGR